MKLGAEVGMTNKCLLALSACVVVIASGCAGKKKTGAAVTKSDPIEKAAFAIKYPGSEYLIDYEKYGEFKGVGTSEFQYVIKNHPMLIKASGEGIYPNIDWVKRDP